MIVGRLKPWVTSFSEAIKAEKENGDEVRIGGVILDIFDMSELAEGEGVYMKIDDGVGINDVFLPKPVFDAFTEKYAFAVGDIVIAQGKVIFIAGTIKRNKLHPEHTKRIACWEMVPISEKESAVSN